MTDTIITRSKKKNNVVNSLGIARLHLDEIITDGYYSNTTNKFFM